MITINKLNEEDEIKKSFEELKELLVLKEEVNKIVLEIINYLNDHNQTINRNSIKLFFDVKYDLSYDVLNEVLSDDKKIELKTLIMKVNTIFDNQSGYERYCWNLHILKLHFLNEDRNVLTNDWSKDESNVDLEVFRDLFEKISFLSKVEEAYIYLNYVYEILRLNAENYSSFPFWR